eukprot:TRINITY_DN75330_c0_g1_i1.p1 TRINITY_DN75330_c0_g1~~TRINITY_DN75330_c0_g1_i1.p1  ORF type:complete len:496 (-),score=67.56 TRINITY_DN75330_c0_g1_i1:1-1488(-)
MLSLFIVGAVLASLSEATLRIATHSRLVRDDSRRLAVLVAGHASRYLPRSTIDQLIASGVKAGLQVDYYVALAGNAESGLESQLRQWLDAAGGRLAYLRVNQSGKSIAIDAKVRQQMQPRGPEQLAQVISALHAEETRSGTRYRQIMLVRDDAFWTDAPAKIWTLPVDRAYFRGCGDTGSLAVAYVLPRADADAFLNGYASFLKGGPSERNMSAELYIHRLVSRSSLKLQGLGSVDLPVVPARQNGDFRHACAVPSFVDGCVSPASLPRCKRNSLVLSEAPCLDGSDLCYSRRQKLPPDKVLRFYQLAHLVGELFKRHEIWHVAAGGTLLGAVRNKGIIPHDDDVDFSIMRSPGSSTLLSDSFQNDMERNGLFLAGVHQDFWKIKDRSEPDVFVDVFAMVQQGSWLTYDNNMWPGTLWPASILDAGGLTEWQFGSGIVLAPPRSITVAFLDRQFGKGWSDEISCANAYHSCDEIADVEHNLRGRAMPDSPLHDPI